MSKEGIFRYISARSARANVVEDDQRPHRVSVYDQGQPTRLYGSILTSLSERGSAADAKRIAREFQDSPQYLSRVEDLGEDATTLLSWYEGERTRPLTEIEPPQLQDPQALRTRLADSILADTFSSTERSNLSLKKKKLLLKLVDASTRGGEWDPERLPDLPLGTWISRQLVVLPREMPHPGEVRDEASPEGAPDASDDPHPADRRQEVAAADWAKGLSHAHRVLFRLGTSPSGVVSRASLPPADSEPRAVRSPEQQTTPSPKRSSGKDQEGEDAERDGAGTGAPRRRFAPDALQGLDDRTRDVASRLGLDLTSVEPREAIRRIEGALAEAAAARPSVRGVNRLLMMQGGTINLDRVRDSFGIDPFAEREPLMGGRFGVVAGTCKQSVGIGDLLIAKRWIKAYEVTEFAHVENVLAGESRLREHRRRRLQEDILTEETERITEKERDLQSTDRSELQSEAEETLQTETGLEAGLQMSGSYGPSISFTSNLGATFRASTEETSRRAATFAKEVVERTAERIRERVREERVTRVVQETEEVNRHEIVNDDDEHVRGIYRWLNKIYDAQIFRYGQRMLFEFVVPEPAAFFLYSMIDSPPDDRIVEKPDPPMYEGEPLRPSHLDRVNYQDYVSQYHPVGVQEPPDSVIGISHNEGEDAPDQSTLRILGRTTKIRIPEGYEAYEARLHIDYTRRSGETYSARVRIGGESVDRSGGSTGGVHDLTLTPTRGELALTVFFDDVFNYTVGVDVSCSLTTDGFARWQHQTYDLIIEAYQRQKSAYEEQMRARAIQGGVPVLGRNPLENRRIERNELKRLVVQFLTGGRHMGMDVFVPGLDEPTVDVEAACELGKYVQFLENAFEWPNMQYVFYPYFWGRQARWTTALNLTDPDPDFAAFLSAGAARVQVPVRPGYEKAVAYFCQFGEPYEGEDPPLIDDDLYVPIVDEITESWGTEDEGVPFPEGSEPWEVRIPTQLVLIQDLDEIPGIRDVLTSADIGLLPD
jgi:hypothetical protein